MATSLIFIIGKKRLNKTDKHYLHRMRDAQATRAAAAAAHFMFTQPPSPHLTRSPCLFHTSRATNSIIRGIFFQHFTCLH